MAARIAWRLWLLRLSMMTTSPRRSVGTRNCVTQARKLMALTGCLSTHGATMPSQRNAATKVNVFQCPYGTLATSRCPRGQRPCVRVMLVFTQVSSMKAGRFGSILSWCCLHCWRRRATSGRSCSLACRLFFKAETSIGDDTPDSERTAFGATCLQFRRQRAQREIGFLGQPDGDPTTVGLEHERPRSPIGFAFGLPVSRT